MSWHLSNALIRDFGNSLCSQAQAVESLEESYSDGVPSAQWNSMPFAQDDSCSGKMKDTCHRSPYGMMYVHSEDNHGEDLLTWFRAGFHAPTSALPEKAQDSKAQNQSSGTNRPGSLARYDPDSYSWKTHQLLLLEEVCESLQTLPRWGMTVGGELWELKTPERSTRGSVFGFTLPTIGASEGKGSAHNRYRNSIDYRGSKMSEGLRTCLTDPIYLNPSFAEIAMGWPEGWTDSKPLETDKFQQWLNSHGGF